MSTTAEKCPQLNADPIPAPLAHWIQNDVVYQQLSHAQQLAVVETLNPVYHRLVLQARDQFEQTSAISVVFLLWNELLKQCQIGSTAIEPTSLRETVREKYVRQLFETLGVKYKMSGLLLRLRQERHKDENSANSPPLVPDFPISQASP